MFDRAFAQLLSHYQFASFSGLGHSNGGLIYTAFLQRYFQKYEGVTMEKLLTIASPYNLNRKNPDKQTDMLKDFLAQQDRLPANLQHLSIIGLFLGETDGIVHRTSVEAGRLIYKGRIHSHQEVVITGKKAHHSALVLNDEVISLIKKFLFT
ncbi:Cell surface hydrolase [Streptococcus sp. DD11]|nr:Cell surface hydrolase [Streptococcus sp. DD11]